MPGEAPLPFKLPHPPCRGGLAAKEQRALTSPGLPLLALSGSQEGLATKRGTCHCLCGEPASQQPASQQLPQPLPGVQKGLCREPRSPCQGGRKEQRALRSPFCHAWPFQGVRTSPLRWGGATACPESPNKPAAAVRPFLQSGTFARRQGKMSCQFCFNRPGD